MMVEAYAATLERKAAEEGGNAILLCAACCMKCIMKSIEDFVEYLNKTAYAYMAISGENYCKSAWNGLLLNLKHMAKYYYAV